MNIVQRLSGLLAGMRFAAERSAELMAPHRSSCLICGKSAPTVGGSSRSSAFEFLRASLCEVCFSAIPWLNRPVCLLCGRGIRCEDCLRRPQRPFRYNRSAVSYSSAMREWLASYKYRGNESLSPLLAEMLVPVLKRMTEELLSEQGADAKWRGELCKDRGSFWGKRLSQRSNPSAYTRCWDALTYVPISDERAEERGFNQAEQLAAHLSSKFDIPLYGLLTRERHTDKMSFKSRAERMRDAASLFGVNKDQLRQLELEDARSFNRTFSSDKPPALQPASQPILRILLVDDIYTTGSTAEACSAELLRHMRRPATIYVLTWARS